MKLMGIKEVLCPITVMYYRVEESLVIERIWVAGSTIADHREILSRRNNRKKKV